MPGERPPLSWTAQSHEHIERSIDWYWALGVIAIAGAVLAVLFGNVLLAAIVLLGALSLGIVSAREPGEHRITLAPQGIAIDNKLYPWRSLRSFWLDEETREDMHLIVSTNAVFTPQVVIPVPHDIPADEIRARLRGNIEEKEQYESMLTRVTELLGI